MRRWQLALMSAIGAGTLALVLAWFAVPPSHEDVRTATASLVPSHAEVTHIGALTGHPLIVGSGYFAVVDFRAAATASDELKDHLRDQAMGAGWEVTHEFTSANGSVVELRRGLISARATFGTVDQGGVPTNDSFGTVRGETNGDAVATTVVLWTAVATALVGTAVWLVAGFVRTNVPEIKELAGRLHKMGELAGDEL